MIKPPKSSLRTPDCSPLQPSFYQLPVSAHLQEPVLLRPASALSFTEDCKVAKSSSSQGSSQLLSARARDGCDLRIPQAREGRAESRLRWAPQSFSGELAVLRQHPPESSGWRRRVSAARSRHAAIERRTPLGMQQ